MSVVGLLRCYVFTVTSVLLAFVPEDGELCGDVTGFCCDVGVPCVVVTIFGAPGCGSALLPAVVVVSIAAVPIPASTTHTNFNI